jgi:hypothetical protein
MDMYRWTPTLTGSIVVDSSSARYSAELVEAVASPSFTVEVYTTGLSPEEVAETLVAGLEVSIARRGGDDRKTFLAIYGGDIVADIDDLHPWAELSPTGPVKGLAVVYGEPEEIEE